MSANTKIEWPDHTFNPWIGCTKVGPGCDNCYAKADWEDRRHRVTWGAGHDRSRTKTWGDPVKWNKTPFFECEGCGRRGTQAELEMTDERECDCTKHMVPVRQRVFCASLADVFDNEIDPMWRAELFELISETPNLDWMLLTKRIGNAAKMLPVWYEDPAAWVYGGGVAHPNVWIGATIVNQEEADRDIPKLFAVPAAKRFLSMEPLLGPVDLHNYLILQCDRGSVPVTTGVGGVTCPYCQGHEHLFGCALLDWVIVGGESGPGARPMHPDWARSLRDQCQAAGVPYLFKQWGEWVDGDGGRGSWLGSVHQGVADCYLLWDGRQVSSLHSGATAMHRVGKKAAGRLLDGRTWDEAPV